MKKHSCMIFVDILLLIGVVYLFSMCNNSNNVTHKTDNINYYIDTIKGHVILTTVLTNNSGNRGISVSSLELKD